MKQSLRKTPTHVHLAYAHREASVSLMARQPGLRLDLGPRWRYLYAVEPHSLFVGGVQLEVQDVLGEDAHASRSLPAQDRGNHA